jgi:hypothetical protein
VKAVIAFTSRQPRADDQEQPEHEQQVIESRQNMLDPHLQIGGNGDAFRSAEREGVARVRRANDGVQLVAVARSDAKQDVGDAVGESLDPDRPTVERGVAERPHVDAEAGLDVHAVGFTLDRTAGQVGDEMDGEIADHRLLPQNAPGVGRGLVDLEQRRANLVRRRRLREDRREQQRDQQPDHRAAPSIETRYIRRSLRRNASLFACRRSAR